MSTNDLTALITASEPASEPSAAIGTQPAPAPALRARTRWAGIVWGLVLAGLAWAGIWLASAPDRVDELVTWLRGIDTATAVAYGLLALGALVLVTGVVGLLRRAQRALTRS